MLSFRHMHGILVAVFLILGVFVGAPQANAVVPEGGTCEITAFPQKLINAYRETMPDLQILSSTCQKSQVCDDNAPIFDMGNGPTKARIIQYINTGGCDENAAYACCIYFSPKKEEPTSSAIDAGSSMKLDNPVGTDSILILLRRVIQTFIGVLGAIALLGMIYAGVVWMTAGGDSSKVKHAQDTMRYGLIGLTLITFSYVIVSFLFRAVAGV